MGRASFGTSSGLLASAADGGIRTGRRDILQNLEKLYVTITQEQT
jgi:hypothetical protein